ncbi:amidohydrolase family protein [Streptomyces sp. NPDC058773]|uniref:amidohydrolase family protein n=1 Tax=Streptomyces sp. NPDC058773 TaxID=3346632 RepID=UPI003686D6D2
MTGTIDTDLHCAPRTMGELAEYLPAYWQQYAAEGAIRLTDRQRSVYPAPDDGDVTTTAVPATAEEIPDCRGSSRTPIRATLLTCTVLFDLSRNPEFEAVGARALNTWMRETFLAVDPALFGSAVIPTLDTERALAEVERIAEDGRFVQILLPVRNDFRYGEPRYRRVLEAAAAADLVVCLHAGGRTGLSSSPTGYQSSFVEDTLLGQHRAAQNQLVSIATSDLLVRHERFRLTLAECGFSWLPPLLWRLDKDWKSLWREIPWLDRKPSDHVLDRVRCTLEPGHLPVDDEEFRAAADMCEAPRTLMYSSDHPHRYRSAAQRLLSLLDDADRGRILHGNAREHYRRLPAE